MKFEELDIFGAYLIHGEPFKDDRGSFRRNFCSLEFESAGISSNVAQANISQNKFKYTLRGFHYQLEPYAESKSMTCYTGKIIDVIIDLRPNSPTYLKHCMFEIDSNEFSSFHVPAGCANAFLTLEDNTIVHYYCSNKYHPESERGIRFDDPLFGIKWPILPNVISQKDASWENYVAK